MPRRRDAPRSKQKLRLVIPVAVGIVAAVIGINAVLMMQTPDSTQYVTELQEISDQSIVLTQGYEESISQWEKGLMDDGEMLEVTGKNLGKLESLLSRLKGLEPPDQFKEGHEMSVQSLEYELQSNKHMQKYIETGDLAEYEKSSDLFQLAFDYESKAFEAFARANKNT